MKNSLHFPVRTGVAVLATVAEAVGWRQDELSDLDRLAVDRVRVEIRELVNAALVAASPLPDDRLDDVVDSAAQVVERYLATRLPRATERFETLRQQMDCEQCAAASSATTWCTRERDNDTLLSSTGHCTSAFRGLSCEIERYVRSRYDRYVLHALPELSIQYSLRGVADESHLGFGVGGMTSCLANVPQRVEVAIEIAFTNSKDPPLRFGTDSYFYVPYLLFHELCSHAFHGLHSTVWTAGTGIHPDDEFCEGWMDHVAFEFCDAWSRGCAQPSGLRSRFGDAALDYHRERIGGPHANRGHKDLVFRKRTRGVEAAKKWKRLLQETTANYEEAQMAFFASSLGWNTLGLRGKQGERLVGLMHATDAAGPGVHQWIRDFVVELADNFLESMDYKETLANLLAIDYS